LRRRFGDLRRGRVAFNEASKFAASFRIARAADVSLIPRAFCALESLE